MSAAQPPEEAGTESERAPVSAPAPAADSGSPIRIAVVGHTNAGKTSLLRTLTRRVDFGEVSERPGTTRHVETVELQVHGRAAVRFFDTPGLEDAVALREHLDAFAEPGAQPSERVRRFLRGPEALGVFEQEAKVLRALLQADAAFLVIDVREPVLPKFRAEVALLASCAKPVLPVLNFIRAAPGREADWRALLSDAGLHAVVRFDATAPFTGAERDLYQDLGTLLPAHRSALRGVVDFLDAEALARRHAACTRIATLLVETAALRRPASAEDWGDPQARQACIDRLQHEVLDRAQRGADALLLLYGFRKGDAGEAPLPPLQGRWALDLFNPDALKDAGLLLGKGAAVGAALGVVADLAMAGLSLGAGAALGGAVGGALAQGWGPFGRKLANLARGVRELSVEDGVLLLLAQRQLALLQALEQRGHADTRRIEPTGTAAAATAPHPQGLARAIHATRPARSRPAWEDSRHGDTPARRAAVAEVAQALQGVLAGMG
nr:GTPase/DUF3482 domain-containing protein [Xylophilus sp. ASV27]